MADAPQKLVGGTLDRTPPVVLFRNLYSDRTTAQLLLSRRGEERTFWWDKGQLVWASSNREAQIVGETLRTFGLADEAVLFTAFERVLAEPGRGLSKALSETGAVPAFVADACVRALAERILFDTLTWGDGSYTLTPATDTSPAPVKFDRSNANLILEGLRRLPPGAAIPGVKVEPRSRAIFSTSLLLRYQALSLLPDESAAIAKVDPDRPVNESEIDLAILARFVAIGIVELLPPGKMPDQASGIDKSGSLNVEVAGTAPLSRAAEVAEQQAALVKNTYRRIDWVTLYEIVGSTREAALADIQRAVHDRARLFHPDQAFRSHLSDQREALETLFHKVRAAERTFRSDDTRRSYDATLTSGGNVVHVEDTAPTRDVQEQIARANYTRSRTLFEMGDFFPAYEMMKQAVEFDPERWEYWVLLSRIQRKNPKWVRQSAETMRRAVAKIPGNVEVLFELAEACQAERNETERVKALKEILGIDPGNRRAQSALAEIAAMKPGK